MTREEVVQKVKECIVKAVGVSFDDIKLDSQIINDLGADSLDLVELMFQLETTLDVSLQRGAIIQRIRKVIPEEEFVDDEGFVSEAGKDLIKQEIKELKDVDFPEKLMFNNLLSYFTTDIFVNLIIRALEEKKNQEGNEL